MNADLLIYRYKNGSISTKDEEQLLQWVKSSDENRNYFKQYARLVSAAENLHLSFNQKAGFQSFLNSTSTSGKTRKMSFYPLLKIAAVIVLFLGFGYLMSDVLFSTGSKMMLVEADINLEKVLSDNSEVTLRSGSVLAYPKTFKKETREVELQGEAFFNVERNEEKPFIVNVGEVVIEVLGTSFDVSENKELQLVTVTVETGQVRVTCKALNYEKILNPKEQCMIHFGENAIVDEVLVENKNHLGWLTGVLDFEETKLEDVVSVLNNMYDKKIILGTDSIKNCKLTTKINNYPLPDVIKMLEQTLDLQVVENDEAYILIGEGCNN